MLPARCLRRLPPPLPPPRRSRGAAPGVAGGPSPGGGRGGWRPLPLWQRALAAGAVAGVAGGLWLWLRAEKGRRERARRRGAAAGALGPGPPPALELRDAAGRARRWAELRGSSWALLYFGFTRCPDVCPAALERLGRVLELLEEGDGGGRDPPLLPLFITLDPERDHPAALGRFLRDFHPRLLGLTGPPEAVAAAAAACRVYAHRGPADADGDYLLDHSALLYLLGPDGTLRDCYGPARSAPDIARSVRRHMDSEPPPQ